MGTGKIFNVVTGETTTEKTSDVVLSADDKLRHLRVERNKRLGLTDVWALSDRTMTAEMKNYRQKLRDLPSTQADPADIVWPTKPE